MEENASSDGSTYFGIFLLPCCIHPQEYPETKKSEDVSRDQLLSFSEILCYLNAYSLIVFPSLRYMCTCPLMQHYLYFSQVSQIHASVSNPFYASAQCNAAIQCCRSTSLHV